MTVQSMTGFGRAELEGEHYSLTVELKAVNNRYKDFRFKMGSVFNSIEMQLKKQMEKSFSRGSFDIFINYKKSTKQKELIDLDHSKIDAFLNQMEGLIKKHPNINMQIQPTEFLRNDFYEEDDSKEEELQSMLQEVFPKAIAELVKSRQEEGEKLVEKLAEHKRQYESHLSEISRLKNGYQDKVKEKLKKRFDEMDQVQVEESRFLQEVVYYLEKLDVDEELNRIDIHLEKLEKLLNSDQDIGRQIDFLVQELNRETNTIGSKSGDQGISERVVQMKVQLEKIREQALNLQ